MIGIMVLTMSSKFIQGSEEVSDSPTSINVEKAKSKPTAAQPATPKQEVGPTSAPAADSAAK
jgi:hypothetical protein